jgi:hypothetical protein
MTTCCNFGFEFNWKIYRTAHQFIIFFPFLLFDIFTVQKVLSGEAGLKLKMSDHKLYFDGLLVSVYRATNILVHSRAKVT